MVRQAETERALRDTGETAPDDESPLTPMLARLGDALVATGERLRERPTAPASQAATLLPAEAMADPLAGTRCPHWPSTSTNTPTGASKPASSAACWTLATAHA